MSTSLPFPMPANNIINCMLKEINFALYFFCAFHPIYRFNCTQYASTRSGNRRKKCRRSKTIGNKPTKKVVLLLPYLRYFVVMSGTKEMIMKNFSIQRFMLYMVMFSTRVANEVCVILQNELSCSFERLTKRQTFLVSCYSKGINVNETIEKLFYREQVAASYR